MTIRLERARIAAFPKGYMEVLCDGRMDLFEWIDMAGTLGVEGIELYPDFLRETGTDCLYRS